MWCYLRSHVFIIANFCFLCMEIKHFKSIMFALNVTIKYYPKQMDIATYPKTLASAASIHQQFEVSWYIPCWALARCSHRHREWFCWACSLGFGKYLQEDWMKLHCSSTSTWLEVLTWQKLALSSWGFVWKFLAPTYKWFNNS